MTKQDLLEKKALLRQAIKVHTNAKYGTKYTTLDVYRIMDGWSTILNEIYEEREEMKKRLRGHKSAWSLAQKELYEQYQKVQRENREAYEEFLQWKRSQQDAVDVDPDEETAQ
jgi:hypothetical protein